MPRRQRTVAPPVDLSLGFSPRRSAAVGRFPTLPRRRLGAPIRGGPIWGCLGAARTFGSIVARASRTERRTLDARAPRVPLDARRGFPRGQFARRLSWGGSCPGPRARCPRRRPWRTDRRPDRPRGRSGGSPRASRPSWASHQNRTTWCLRPWFRRSVAASTLLRSACARARGSTRAGARASGLCGHASGRVGAARGAG